MTRELIDEIKKIIREYPAKKAKAFTDARAEGEDAGRQDLRPQYDVFFYVIGPTHTRWLFPGDEGESWGCGEHQHKTRLGAIRCMKKHERLRRGSLDLDD
jgi:hypothetical protein